MSSKQVYTVFEYDRRWPEVVPVLDHPLVQRALNAGMKDWLEHRKTRQLESRKTRSGDITLSPQELARYTWDPERGPWCYSDGDGWYQKADDQLYASPEWQAYQSEHHDDDADDITEEERRVLEELASRFYPRPNTPDWFRCYGACHWLSGWNCAVGTILMPDRGWYIVGTTRHRNAIGIGQKDAVFMDILWCNMHHPTKIRAALRRGRCRTLEDELTLRESHGVEIAPEVPLRDLLAGKR